MTLLEMKKKILQLIEEIKEDIDGEVETEGNGETATEEVESAETETEETIDNDSTVVSTKIELTDDPDIANKINSVINQVQFELARMKKITAYCTQEVTSGEIFNLKTIADFYQLKLLRVKNTTGEDASYEIIDDMVIFNENGVANIFYYKYPPIITDDTTDNYVFELSQDALEILPYGAAADILKSDVSTNYGKIYEQRYETMLQRLDSRYSTGTISVEGGVNI